MVREKYELWIEAEQWEDGWDIHNATTDVIVKFDNGDRWVASFFTYSYIKKIVELNKETGECLGGKYYWSSDMILIDEVSRESIQKVIDHLINEAIDGFGYFECMFTRCENDDDDDD